jgi:hypothetical protein
MNVYGIIDSQGLASLTKAGNKAIAWENYAEARAISDSQGYPDVSAISKQKSVYCLVSSKLSPSQTDILRDLHKSADSVAAAKAFIQFVSSDEGLEVNDEEAWEEINSLFKTNRKIK